MVTVMLGDHEFYRLDLINVPMLLCGKRPEPCSVALVLVCITIHPTVQVS